MNLKHNTGVSGCRPYRQTFLDKSPNKNTLHAKYETDAYMISMNVNVTFWCVDPPKRDIDQHEEK